LALGRTEMGQQRRGAEGPRDTVGRHRIATAGAGVLHDLLGAAGAWGAELELERVAGASRIEPREPEIDRVRDVARPHVLPQAAGLEAATFGARHRRATGERAVADRVDRALADLVERERVERIEQ